MRFPTLAPAVLLVVLHGVSGPAAAQTVSGKHPPPPRALSDAGERGEDLYDAASARHWTAARRLLAALKADVRRLGSAAVGPAGERERLEQEIATLDTTVPRRQRQPTMAAANQITVTVADMTEPFDPAIPVAITRLDYYGRELIIWSAPVSAHRLEAAARGIRSEWVNVQPQVKVHDAALADRFEDLVARVGKASTPSQYRRLAAQVLDEVDDLERAMASAPR